jgi:hypothetical protein
MMPLGRVSERFSQRRQKSLLLDHRAVPPCGTEEYLGKDIQENQPLTRKAGAVSILSEQRKETRGVAIDSITSCALTAAILLILCGPILSAVAQPAAERQTTAGTVIARPSTDTMLVEISINGIYYAVPRNYISKMDNWNGGSQEMVNFRVTFPGFEPLTAKTSQCLTQPRSFWPSGCTPIEFWIHGGNEGPSDDERFNRERELFHSQIPRQGPGGFEVYETGPNNALRETFYKKTPLHTLVIECLFYELNGRRDAICENYSSPLQDGNSLSYRLDLAQMANAEEIDNGIRHLVDSFSLKGPKHDAVHP